SFETVSPVPPGFPFGFSSLSDLFRPDSRWRDSPSGFHFPVFPTLSDPLSAEPIGVRISGSNSEEMLQRFTEGIP
ncbi:hypothetical protein ABZ746_09995, partial [Streptomyces sp. NPDC020096]